MITRWVVCCLGVAQIVSWGTSYYLIGAFGPAIASDFGWSESKVYGGFSLALLVMGLSSGMSGRLIDRFGGRPIMTTGALINAVGCVLLASSHSETTYYTAWAVLGVAMRLTLYDAAFAALARIAGPKSRSAMSQITLFGGFASTIFWPLGSLIATQFGWRGAVFSYAAIAASSLVCFIWLPASRYEREIASPLEGSAPSATDRHQVVGRALAFVVISTVSNFLNAAMTSHMIAALVGMGLGASAAVAASSLRGVGQFGARACEVLSRGKFDAVLLTMAASVMLPISFIVGSFAGHSPTMASCFAFLFGAGNGVITITRGTLPLLLFDINSYGSLVGRLLAPSFILSAGAPLVMAWITSVWGVSSVLTACFFISILGLAAAVWLRTKVAEVQVVPPTDAASR
jgi:MFS family permease